MRNRWIVTTLALVALLAAGCGATSPAPQTPTVSDTPTAQPSPKPMASNGTVYAVDTERSTAAYAVRERFLGKELDVTAVGKTSTFTGELIIENGVIQPSTIQIDLSTLTSDEARRDNQVRRALDTASHRHATFQITGAQGDPVLTEGQDVDLQLNGNMTIKGTERPLTFATKAKLADGTVTLTAETTFTMTDFGVTPPSIAGFVSVTDKVTLHITYVGIKQ